LQRRCKYKTFPYFCIIVTKIKLSKRTFIRPFFAAALLVLFALSAAPRSWLHDLFAKHKDSYGFLVNDAKTTVTAQHINCQCDSIVVHEPYLLEQPATLLALLPFSNQHDLLLKEPVLPSQPLFIELRGPPSLA